MAMVRMDINVFLIFINVTCHIHSLLRKGYWDHKREQTGPLVCMCDLRLHTKYARLIRVNQMIC